MKDILIEVNNFFDTVYYYQIVCDIWFYVVLASILIYFICHRIYQNARRESFLYIICPPVASISLLIGFIYIMFAVGGMCGHRNTSAYDELRAESLRCPMHVIGEYDGGSYTIYNIRCGNIDSLYVKLPLSGSDDNARVCILCKAGMEHYCWVVDEEIDKKAYNAIVAHNRNNE